MLTCISNDNPIKNGLTIYNQKNCKGNLYSFFIILTIKFVQLFLDNDFVR